MSYMPIFILSQHKDEKLIGIFIIIIIAIFITCGIVVLTDWLIRIVNERNDY